MKYTIKANKGTGYWDLTHYPWGGSFRRLTEDYEGDIEDVFDQYNDLSPRKIAVRLPGNIRAGLTVSGRDVIVTSAKYDDGTEVKQFYNDNQGRTK